SLNSTNKTLTLSANATASGPQDLVAGTKVPLFAGLTTNNANFINTVLDDDAVTLITAAQAPFTGTFKPTGSLAALNGHAVDIKNTVGQWVPGVWMLELTNSKAGISGTLSNWSLNIAPTIKVTPLDPVTQQPTNAATTTLFQIGYPQQQLS